MKTFTRFRDLDEFVEYVRKLRKQRKKVFAAGGKRPTLPSEWRSAILRKTKRKCHICGGKILIDESWHADHVMPYAQGGMHSIDNFLPAHSTCNNYRWYFSAEEIQLILKLGVWVRTVIEKQDVQIANELAEKFLRHEIAREKRQRKKQSG